LNFFLKFLGDLVLVLKVKKKFSPNIHNSPLVPGLDPKNTIVIFWGIYPYPKTSFLSLKIFSKVLELHLIPGTTFKKINKTKVVPDTKYWIFRYSLNFELFGGNKLI
jgi:hypothetical protein